MWNTALAINSFIIWPMCSIFFLYSVGRGILTTDWKLFVIAGILWLLTTLAAAILAMLSG